MKAILRKSRISPRKASLLAGMVRGKSVNDALDFLRFAPKKSAKILYKVVQSASANAEKNFGKDKNNLKISSIIVNTGPTYKRGVPASRGRVAPILKRTSHITVELS